MKKYKIDEDTRFRFELQEKINYYNVKAMTEEELEELLEEYENESIFITREGEEYYSKDFETREVDYQAVEEDELSYAF